MLNDSRHITMLASNPESPARPWDVSGHAPNRVMFVDAFSVLCHALDQATENVDRILIDGTVSSTEYLQVLAALPQSFTGDVLYMRAGGNSFLSATGRGGDRLLYALMPSDLEFYLQTNRLVA
jgi:hypothetical protein